MLQGGRAEAGQVIPFGAIVGRERRSDRVANVPLSDGRGTVLLFTGVRYSRMVDPAAPEPEGAATSSELPPPESA